MPWRSASDSDSIVVGLTVPQRPTVAAHVERLQCGQMVGRGRHRYVRAVAVREVDERPGLVHSPPRWAEGGRRRLGLALKGKKKKKVPTWPKNTPKRKSFVAQPTETSFLKIKKGKKTRCCTVTVAASTEPLAGASGEKPGQ